MGRNDRKDRGSEIKLTSLLTIETIKTQVSVQNWEEAAEQVGNLLVQAGYIQPSYIEAMKRVLLEMGPYAIIAPGIALLHARPEDGVVKPCLGLVTLATPILFGHSQNDPVDIVFALGACDKKGHINALQQLARLLSNEEVLKRLRSAQNEVDLLKIIKSRTS